MVVAFSDDGKFKTDTYSAEEEAIWVIIEGDLVYSAPLYQASPALSIGS